jgi:hypothetical protein
MILASIALLVVFGSLILLLGVNNEAGHHANRVYADQGGNLHLNGSILYLDELGAGNQLTANGLSMQGANANVVALGNVATGIVANGNTQANAVLLTAAINVVANSVANNNGVSLPIPTYINQDVTVIDSNATGIVVYPDANGTGGQINGAGNNTGVALAGSKGTTYQCYQLNPSRWWSLAN